MAAGGITAASLNRVLHRMLGVWDACQSACTHEVVDGWTALGIANVIGRADERQTYRTAGNVQEVK